MEVEGGVERGKGVEEKGRVAVEVGRRSGEGEGVE